MSTTTYYNPNTEFCLEIRQWFLDNPQDDDDFSQCEPYKNVYQFGGWNEKIHRQIDWSSLRSGKNNPMYGSKRTGSENPFYGKKHSEETKAKLRLAWKRRKGLLLISRILFKCNPII